MPWPRGICELLKAHVKDIHIIDQQKVADLVDERGMEDYLEIGKALKAEKVVGIDIESFSVLEGPDALPRPVHVSTVQVYDVAEKQRRVAQRAAGDPVSHGLAAFPKADLTEMEFRNQFVAILAEEIARYFYPHDRHDDYCRDALSVH